jgi:hypothetical protein
MFTNDRYVAMLEKMASDDSDTEDNASIARKEYNSNRKDNRAYLGSIFNKADEVEQQMTSAAGKVLDAKNESGSPFIKVARAAFDQSYAQTEFSKIASDTYREVAFRSFVSELEKLAALKPQTMAQLATKNRIAASSPKVWDLSSPISSGAKAALPAGSGTSVHQPGILSRAAKAFGLGK